MKVAILFTGALRTIKKTIRYFKCNLLLNENVHVFACLQNDTHDSSEQLEAWLKSEIGTHLKSLQWFKINEHSHWVTTRNNLVDNLPCADNWKDYLKNSGSILEYYQLYLAYLKMCDFEAQDSRYEYIIRSRTDTIFAQPIDFHWLKWSDDDVQRRLQKINDELHLSNIPDIPQNKLNYFMNTIISDKLINSIQVLWTKYLPASNSTPKNASELNKFIKEGRYILTIRANNLYVVRREYFQMIPTLSFIYGHLRSPYNDEYWFNAENQFRSACFHSGLTIFDYNSGYEDESLYNYDEKKIL